MTRLRPNVGIRYKNVTSIMITIHTDVPTCTHVDLVGYTDDVILSEADEHVCEASSSMLDLYGHLSSTGARLPGLHSIITRQYY